MGRYDKIKVYNGTEWKQPTRIRVYQNNGWLDLGTYDSSNTNTLSVCKDNTFVRATLNKRITEVPGISYVIGGKSGTFSLLDASDFGYNPNGTYLDSNKKEQSLGDWYFRATIRKTSDTSMTIFRSENSKSYLKIVWNANGTITITTKSSWGTGEEQSVTTTNAVKANQWVYLDITTKHNSTKTKIVFNGVTTEGSLYERWSVTNATNTVGQTGLQFKDTFTIRAQTYSKGPVVRTINMSSASGTTGDYADLQLVSETTYKTDWV